MKTRAHIYISGKVQGVFFRANTTNRAQDLGLTGWVRNLPDGRVEVMAEGEEEKVEELIEWCKEGPSLAEVKDIDLTYEDYQGKWKGFKIKY